MCVKYSIGGRQKLRLDRRQGSRVYAVLLENGDGYFFEKTGLNDVVHGPDGPSEPCRRGRRARGSNKPEVRVMLERDFGIMRSG